MAELTPVPVSMFSVANGAKNRITATKPAGPQLMIDSTTVDPLVIYSLIFEDLAGKELINIARNDVVNGQNISYKPISNLPSLGQKYNSQNIIPVQGASKEYFDNFPIKLEKKIPDSGTGPFNEIVYIDPNTKDLVINVTGLLEDEQVEVQILSSGSILNDTIYNEGVY